MAMTRRDFEHVAGVVKAELRQTPEGARHTERALVHVAAGIAAWAGRTNERFSPDLFFSACEIPEEMLDKYGIDQKYLDGLAAVE